MNEVSRAPKSASPSVAICTVLRDERRYILEWIAHHRLLGVERFLIYDNESRDGGERLLAALQARGLAAVVTWKGGSLQTQLDAFLAGAKALRFNADFVAFLDLDEFLGLDGDESLTSVLRSMPADVSALAVCQRVFGSGWRPAFEPDLVTARFTSRAPDSRDEHRWVKTIARPEFVLHFTSPHSVALSFGRYVMTDGLPFRPGAHAGAADRLSHGRVHINHYMLKSREEFEAKQRRGGFLDAQQALRLDDSYFSARDPDCNAVVDRQAAGRAAEVRAEISRMIDGFDPDLRRMIFDDLGL